MGIDKTKELIQEGGVVLGIEFGSTRIKGVLIDGENQVIASGSYDWENRLKITSGPTAWRIYGRGFRAATGI